MTPPSTPSSPAGPHHTSRRGALRVTGLNLDATFTVQGDTGPQRGLIADLSATGALLMSPQAVAVGQTMHIEFNVPKGPRIRGRATVMRCRPADDAKHAVGLSLDVSVDEELDLATWVFDRV